MTFDNTKKIRKIAQTSGSDICDKMLDEAIEKCDLSYEQICIDIADSMMKIDKSRKKK